MFLSLIEIVKSSNHDQFPLQRVHRVFLRDHLGICIWNSCLDPDIPHVDRREQCDKQLKAMIALTINYQKLTVAVQAIDLLHVNEREFLTLSDGSLVPFVTCLNRDLVPVFCECLKCYLHLFCGFLPQLTFDP